MLGFDPAPAGASTGNASGSCSRRRGSTRSSRSGSWSAYYRADVPAPARRRELLDLVGLAEKRDARVKTLSGGQRRRLDLALGLVGDPDLLFLDEPTTGFDPSARRRAWELMESCVALGKTVLLTTHYMDEAEHLADRVAVCVAGRLVAAGTPEELGGAARHPPHRVRPARRRCALRPTRPGPYGHRTGGRLCSCDADDPASAL